MRWGSFDPFLLGDAFWQDKMGMPVANKEFLRALLQYGTFESYTFFCEDNTQLLEFQKTLPQLVPAECSRRVKLSMQALFNEETRKTPVDIMHNGDFTYFMPYLIELRNKMTGLPPFPVSGVTHSLDTVSLYGKCIQFLMARPQPFDTIVCSSRCAVEMLESTFGHILEAFETSFCAKLPEPPSFAVIPLGIPEEAFAPKDRFQCRKELGIPVDHFVMLSLARFSPRRKMDLAPLLETIEWLRARRDIRFPQFTLILAGAGRTNDLKLAQEMLLQLGLQNNARIESNVTAEKKTLFYGAADVFLSLVDNYQETFGLTILEAMAQGLPVVASDFNGYRELVAHGHTGFLIPTCGSMNQEPWDSLSGLLSASVLRFYRAQKVAFDICELSEALLALATNPDLRKDMASRARVRALPFSWRWIIGLYEEMWKERKARADRSATSLKESAKGLPMLTPFVHKSFYHYPSRWLTAKTAVTLSNYGRSRAQYPFRPILYEELAVILHEGCRDFLIQRLAERNWTIGELLDGGQLHFGFSRESVLLHFDWLVKHGFVTFFEKNRK